jgi:AraC-like DNA-binding protein
MEARGISIEHRSNLRLGARAASQPSTSDANTSTFDDPREPLAVRFEVLARGDVRKLRGHNPSLVLPFQSSPVAVTLRGLPAATRLDETMWLLVPAGQLATLRSTDGDVSVVTLSPYPILEARMREVYRGEVEPKTIRRLLATPCVLPRTRWVHELAHRYLFERYHCRKSRNDATRFLEVEILKEWYFVRRDSERESLGRRAHHEADDPLIARALQWIDEHLGERVTVANLARATHASESALLRAFRRALRQAPATYLRTRRLDEAMKLLRTGRMAVREVAERVGYTSFTAFSHAFRARFGEVPSSFVPC